VADNPHRPMDLRALQSGALQQPAGGDGAPAAVGSWQALLQAGSAIAAEARAALKVCCGCECWRHRCIPQVGRGSNVRRLVMLHVYV